MRSRIFAGALCLFAMSIHAQPPESFIRAKDRQLVIGPDERPIRLRGIGFVNDIDWLTYANLDWSVDHSEIDFQRVRDMGMNVVRFELDYRFFEDDATPYTYQQQGWDWLDTNVTWARRYGIFLILDMHIGQGGLQDGPGPGDSLWLVPEKQRRLKAFWYAIANRYHSDTLIAAYDLLNEPFPIPADSASLWGALAQEIIDTIRTVDTNHLVIVEESFGLVDHYFSAVNDDNVMYDFHFYLPHRYALSYNGLGDGGAYPDSAVCLVGDYVTADETVLTDSVLTDPLPVGDSGWAVYESPLYTVGDTLIVEAIPFIGCGANGGSAYFDDFVLEEYNAAQQLTRRVSIDIEYLDDVWVLPRTDPIESYANNWAAATGGSDDGCHDSSASAHSGDYSVQMTGVADYCRLRDRDFGLLVKKGYSYKIKGWMKGEGITTATCRFGMEFYRIPDIAQYVPFDKNYLESALQGKLQFAIDNNAPANVGEVGASRWCYTSGFGGFSPNRGGLQWITDLVDLFNQYGINYQYFAYHLQTLGMYFNHGDFPDPDSSNQDLIGFFTQELTSLADPIPSLLVGNAPVPASLIRAQGCVKIVLDIAVSGRARLEAYDNKGRLVQTVLNSLLDPGRFTALWDTRALASGVYVLTLEIQGRSGARTLVLAE